MESMIQNLKSPIIDGIELKSMVSSLKEEVQDNHTRIMKLLKPPKTSGGGPKSRKLSKRKRNSSCKNK